MVPILTWGYSFLMALDGDRLGDAIAIALAATNPRATGVHLDRMKNRWRIVAHKIIEEIQDHADVLPAAHAGLALNNPVDQHLSVPALGILDSFGGQCTGIATTGVTSILKVIEGKGSVQ